MCVRAGHECHVSSQISGCMSRSLLKNCHRSGVVRQRSCGHTTRYCATHGAAVCRGGTWVSCIRARCSGRPRARHAHQRCRTSLVKPTIAMPPRGPRGSAILAMHITRAAHPSAARAPPPILVRHSCMKGRYQIGPAPNAPLSTLAADRHGATCATHLSLAPTRWRLQPLLWVAGLRRRNGAAHRARSAVILRHRHLQSGACVEDMSQGGAVSQRVRATVLWQLVVTA